MARPRASDHDAKRKAILQRAAALFSERSYAGASMADIAEACGSSKALLYHYYENKEALLFDILHAHFVSMEEIVAEADRPGLEPHQRLRALIGALLVAYEGADATHRVQINDLGNLPEARQQALKDFERRLVARFATAIADVSPGLKNARSLIKPVTMSLFGMLNWSYLWFKPAGPMSRAQYADLVTQIMTEGISRLADPPSGKPRARRTRRAVQERS